MSNKIMDKLIKKQIQEEYKQYKEKSNQRKKKDSFITKRRTHN